MKILESNLFNEINSFIGAIQEKTDNIRQNSFILSKIDLFILISIILTFVVSTFCSTNVIGYVSALVPILVTIKVLMTKGEKIELEKCNFFLLIYLLICLISNFTSSMIPQSLYGFMKTLIYFGFYFALCQFLKNNRNYIPFLIFIIAILMGIEGIIGLIQNAFGLENISTWQDLSYVNPEDVLSRVYGTLQPLNPNLFAGYLIAGISALAGLSAVYLINKKHLQTITALILFLITGFTLFLTGCRGAYLAVLVMGLLAIWASYNIIFKTLDNDKYKKLWKISITVLIIGSVLFMLINHGIWQRLMSIFILRGDSSTSFRMNVYHSAFQMFHDNFLYGIGVGNKVFREIYGLYMLSGFDALSCYSVFLEMAVESGIFALIAYLMFLGTLIINTFKKFINSCDINLKIILLIALISIIGVMVHGLFDTIYFRPQVQYIFWTMAAILTVLIRKSEN